MSLLSPNLNDQKTSAAKIEKINKSHLFKELYKTFGEISKRAENFFESYMKNNNGIIQQLKELAP